MMYCFLPGRSSTQLYSVLSRRLGSDGATEAEVTLGLKSFLLYACYNMGLRRPGSVKNENT